jgi:drug/metabolite transporter (DMT)-like permease
MVRIEIAFPTTGFFQAYFMSPTRPTPQNWVFLVLLGVIWGGSFMAAKVALGGYEPMTVAALRLLIGAAVLVAASYYRGTGLPTVRTHEGRVLWLYCLALGIFSNALPFALLNWAQLHVSSGFAGVCMAAVPLLVLPLSHFLIAGERMRMNKILGFVVGFIGVIILIGPDTFLQSTGASWESVARLACLMAAGGYAIGSIFMRLAPSTSMVAFSAGGLLTGALTMIPTALYFEGVPSIPMDRSSVAVLYLGLMPTAVAMLMLVSIVKSAGPTFMSLVNYQVPVWAVVFGTVLLREDLPPSFVTALALILAGLAASQFLGRRYA